VEVYDTQCGAKMFRASASVREAFAAPFRSEWTFDVEVLARYLAAIGRVRSESRIYEPLASWTAVRGSKIRVWHGIRAVWDLAIIAAGRSPRGTDRPRTTR
jgi:hypothetical protein